jgi:hypothetical protein
MGEICKMGQRKKNEQRVANGVANGDEQQAWIAIVENAIAIDNVEKD